MSTWDEFASPLGDAVAAELRAMVLDYENARERTIQTAVGPSGLGNPCTRCLARQVLGVPVTREFDDPWCAIIGTAVHQWLDEAAAHHNIQRTDHAKYIGEHRVYPDPELLPKGGNADLYDLERFMVIDHKIVSAARLKVYRHNGPGPQYRRQGHLYGLGYVLAGRRVDHVAVAFWNRGGRLSDLYVWTEPYSPAIAREALDRYRTIRDLALTAGVGILPHLPADPDCWDCEGRDVEEAS